jgi:hypothetical protein
MNHWDSCHKLRCPPYKRKGKACRFAPFQIIGAAIHFVERGDPHAGDGSRDRLD